jgi:hypothetical protein
MGTYCSPVRHQTLLRGKMARAYGDEGKAAGCVPLAALLFVRCYEVEREHI